MYLELATALLGSPIVRAVALDVGTAIASQAVQGLAGAALKRRRTPAAPASAAAPQPVLHILPSVEVVSALPGRLRLRVSGLRGDRDRAAVLERRLQHLPGVTAVEANPLTGTILVFFDPRAIRQAEIVTVAEAREARARRKAARAGRAESTPQLLARAAG